MYIHIYIASVGCAPGGRASLSLPLVGWYALNKDTLQCKCIPVILDEQYNTWPRPELGNSKAAG